MSMVIVSGLSGSGKSVALHALEDLGFYCIDNLPVGLLTAFAREFQSNNLADTGKVAAGIDARNHPDQLLRFPAILEELGKLGINCRILFLQAEDATLLKRFSETRRKHPLSNSNTPLADAIERERVLLEPIAAHADQFIDTTHTNVHQLRELVMQSIGHTPSAGFSLLLRSFGYKHGIPADADFVFDARCLPNPHWIAELRGLTGLDHEVADYLEKQPVVHEYYHHIEQFLTDWIPRFKADNRSYLSIAIGCTGGQHRSVYLTNRLAHGLGSRIGEIVTRHRELE
jgi:UPF0042 nucleotide-binding protein